MLMNTQYLAAPTAEKSLDRTAKALSSFDWESLITTDRPAAPATDSDQDRVVLKRGPSMMVLFRGCPCPKTIEPLRRAGVAIGLALAPRELAKVTGLNDFNYVFVRVQRRTRSILAEAVADLEGNSWSIDETPA